MRNLDILGFIQGRYDFLNDTKRRNRVRHDIDLSDSIYEIKLIKDAASDEKHNEHGQR